MAGRALDEVFVAGASGIRLAGDWTLRGLDGLLPALRRALAAVPADANWSLRSIRRMDSFGALLLWQAWGDAGPWRWMPTRHSGRSSDASGR